MIRSKGNEYSPLLSAVSVLYLLCLIGCAQYETEIVNIKVKVDAKIDMKRYNSLSVLDFVNLKGDNDEHGKLISRIVRRQLKENFKVIDEGDISIESSIIRSAMKNPEVLMSIMKSFDADAIIIGGYEFGERYHAVPYILERYSPRMGRIIPEGRTYLQRSYYLKLQIKVIDTKTGEVIFDYSPPIEERVDYNRSSGLSFDGVDNSSYLRSIINRPVREFVKNLIPHYESERRILVK